jgi:hypothetical protein
MKNSVPNRSWNKHTDALTKIEKEILVIYDQIKLNGKIPSPAVVNNQADILKRQIGSGTGMKYLFTCC